MQPQPIMGRKKTADSPQKCPHVGAKGAILFISALPSHERQTTKEQNFQMALQARTVSEKCQPPTLPVARVKSFRAEAGRSLGCEKQNPGRSTSVPQIHVHGWTSRNSPLTIQKGLFFSLKNKFGIVGGWLS